MTEGWLKIAEERTDATLGSCPESPILRAMPIAVIAAFGGIVGIIIVGGDADFGGAWAGVIVGFLAYLYFANETRIYKKRRIEIIESFRPIEATTNGEVIQAQGSKKSEEFNLKTDVNDAMSRETIINICAVSLSKGVKHPREAAEIAAGRQFEDVEWSRYKKRWETAWDELLLNPGMARKYQ